ncbi:uncharacterized protein RSE6_02712 [Rhynchosporium secalis]|uniref:Uncharacterized protein n=1 Tax=Rhynchosporium secalis TaxID=38038 RepID=A0A1E1M0Y1_RHYSE|nr:uncharacterized protein RSE6_02712 [Rhynchosporium secalis]
MEKVQDTIVPNQSQQATTFLASIAGKLRSLYYVTAFSNTTLPHVGRFGSASDKATFGGNQ